MEVYVFPLINVTLFPGTTKPLNIFEPRYLSMVKEAIQTQTPIAIGFVEDPMSVQPFTVGKKLAFVREIAGYGIPQIIEERINGTLLIFLQGQGKVLLGPVLPQSQHYAICAANVIVENRVVDLENTHKLEALRRILTRWVHQHIPDPLQREIFMNQMNQPFEIVGAFSTYLVRDYDLQQVVLEYHDINTQIEFLYRLSQSNELTS